VDRIPHGQDLPKRGSGAAAQDGAIPARKHCRHPSTALRQALVADGVNASVDAMEPGGLHAALDRFGAEAERDQLRVADDAMLSRGNRRDPSVERVRLHFRSHTD
jgi:hypothetical protein